MDLNKSVDEALDDVGGFGKHQFKVWIIFVIILVSGSYALYPITFYEMPPDFICFDNYVWRPCEKDDYCETMK